MFLDVACALALGLPGASVVLRMARGVRATRIGPAPSTPPPGSISVIVPVLDESPRIAACLHGLLSAGPEVGEILVADGGSRDGTIACVNAIAANNPRVRIVDASPVPAGWNGKAWDSTQVCAQQLPVRAG